MSKLGKLKQSEQILIAITLTVIILGGYSLLRFIPEYQNISDLARSAERTERKLLKARVPDEPDENAQQLLAELDDQEQALQLLNEMSANVQQHLAPEDSQELRVLVSQLARDLKVRITANERIKATPTARKVIAKKKRQQAKPAIEKDIIFPANYSWLERMAPNSLYSRPLQRIELAGQYRSIRAFIHEIGNLPWQVTVVRLKLEKQPITPLRGYAQALKAELVLAL